MLALAILAGAWGLLSPLLLLAPVYEPRGSAQPVSRGNAFQAHRAGEALAVLGPSVAAGGLGLAGTVLLRKRRQGGRALTGVAAAGLLALSVLSAATLGPYLFPPALLLVLAAVWLEP